LTRQLALSVGVPVPPGRLLSGYSSAQTIISEIGLPVVLKPRKSFSLDSLYIRSDVRIIKNCDALLTAVDVAEPDQFVVENFFQGFGVGLSVLAKDGNILQAFQHERVHEASLTGGSSYRRSVPIDHDLERAAELILEAIRYTGLAMFE